MPETHGLVLFALACLALTATPGPDMLLIASRSASQGRSAGFASLAGILVGTYCHSLAAAFGLAQLLVVVPTAYAVIRLAGAAYLLYLAWQTFFPGHSEEQRPTLDVHRSDLSFFGQGLITNMLNPKMALFVLALFPQFTDPGAGSFTLQMLVLATILNLTGLIVNGIVILAASRIGVALSAGRRFRRGSQIFLGSVFTALAARLAFDS